MHYLRLAPPRRCTYCSPVSPRQQRHSEADNRTVDFQQYHSFPPQKYQTSLQQDKMALSKMQSVALYTAILITLKFVITHEIRRKGFSNIWDDPVWKNLTSAIDTLTALNSTKLQNSTITIANGTFANGTFANGTFANGTSSTFGSSLPEEKPFYLGFLPRNVFIYTLLVPLQSYWNIGLERLFPARPRGVEVSYQQEKKEKFFDDNEDRDEEVMKRWIAQGRVRRSSVSWGNTFFKWILDMTVGKLWFEVVWHLIDGIVMWEGLAVTLANLKMVSSSRPSIHPSWASRSRQIWKLLFS